MPGYQAIDGVPVTANEWLLNDVLKKEWGFTGTLVTDWDNVGRMVWEQKVCATDVEAATVAVSAGNDLVMNTPQFFTAAQEAVTGGRLDEALVDAAVALAGEGFSTATLDLQGAQITLVEELIATGTPVIVVLIQSKPSALPASLLNAAAVIEAFNPGMQGGRAITELILGLIEPSGRLPISFARHVGQLPGYYNQIRGQHGDRYADLTQEPLFAFGEGLSYTTIEYSDLRLRSTTMKAEETIQATVTLTNTGGRPSTETVQAYITDTVTSATWADRELKAFTQRTIQPGESVDVDITIPAAHCSIVNAAGHRVVEPGSFELLVGKSSRDHDLLRANFTISG